MSKTDEVFEKIVGNIVATIEANEEGKWSQPWVALAGSGTTLNATTNKPYQGMNALVGMFQVALNGYTANLWATYKQWKTKGAQVRKGSKGTWMIKWGVMYICSTCNRKGKNPCGQDGHLNEKRMWANSFTVFNADQVDGFDVPEPKDLGDAPETIEAIETFVANTGADISYTQGNSAHFLPGSNRITLPLREQFDTKEGFYGTLFHELTHWAGDEDRLGRPIKNRFGDDAYAAEELVAELGSAFLAASFGVRVEENSNSAAYLGHWLGVLKEDPRALYRAAKAAQDAVSFLQGLQSQEEAAA